MKVIIGYFNVVTHIIMIGYPCLEVKQEELNDTIFLS